MRWFFYSLKMRFALSYYSYGLKHLFKLICGLNLAKFTCLMYNEMNIDHAVTEVKVWR